MNNLKVIENELVPVYETSTGAKVVYGSELHKVLDVKSRFREWVERRFNDCEALDGEDYQAADISAPSGQVQKEYIIKLDTAKEMAMLERNDKGKQVRRYFIAVEKKYKKEVVQPKERKKRVKSKDIALRCNLNIAEMLIEKIGVDRGIAYSVAINEAEKESECSFGGFKTLLPVVKNNCPSYNASELGKKINEFNPVTAIEVNKALKTLGLQIKDKTWKITDKGKNYGSMMPFTIAHKKGGSHSGYTPVWNNRAIDLLKEYFRV